MEEWYPHVLCFSILLEKRPIDFITARLSISRVVQIEAETL